jgi:ADP-heptose:LPS heptosyltransferase
MRESPLARKLDRHAGVWLCRLLSFLHKAHRVAHRKTTGKTQKILIIELFEMGAAVMLIPSIRYIREQYPEAELHCLTTRTCLPLWERIEALDPDKIHAIQSRSAVGFLIDCMRTIFRLRKTRFDLVIDYELFMRVPAILSGTLKARKRAGFYRYQLEGLYRGDFYDLKCGFNQNSHISKNFLALTRVALEDKNNHPNLKDSILLKVLGIAPLKAFESTHSRTKITLKFPEISADDTYIAVCPSVGSNLSVRNYPIPRLAKVLDSLMAENPRLKLVLLGTGEDRPLSQRLQQTLLNGQDRCVDLCGRSNFADLLDLIAGAEMLITNDNGPAHFAALTNTKTLALFSTDSPFMYGPLGRCVILYSFFHCSPCISAFNHKSSSCQDNLCLQAIDPESVVSVARDVLSAKAKFGTINNSMAYLF